MADTLREEIITSQTAERMLSRVTPMYDDSYVGLWMFQAIGIEYDRLWEILDTLRDQLFPESVTWAIELWERRYGITPLATETLEERRAHVIAAQSVPTPFNPASFISYIRNLTGGNAELDDHIRDYTFGVYIDSDGSGSPIDYATIYDWIRRHKHSHMSFEMWFEATHQITVTVTAEYWRIPYPLAGQALTGQLPDINTLFGGADGEIDASENGSQGYRFPYEMAGTKPDTNIIGKLRDGALALTEDGENYSIMYPLCGVSSCG